MGFKLGAVVGFGAGYYFGAKAGRERYEQLNRWAQKARESDAYESATGKVRDMAAEGVAVARARMSGPAPDDAPWRAGSAPDPTDNAPWPADDLPGDVSTN